MPRLVLSLSGCFPATLDGPTSTGFEPDKVRAMVAYQDLAIWLGP